MAAAAALTAAHAAAGTKGPRAQGGAHDGALPALRRASPHTYLVHSSWAMAQLRTWGPAGYATLGLPLLPGRARTPAAATAAATAAAAGSAVTGAAAATAAATAAETAATAAETAAETTKPVETEAAGGGDAASEAQLLRLARSRADAHGRLILTFATAVYDPLCRNFLAHIRRLRLTHYLLATFTTTYHAALVGRGERAYLHELPSLTSDGSDSFASHDFFLINSARYAARLEQRLPPAKGRVPCSCASMYRPRVPSVWARP